MGCAGSPATTSNTKKTDVDGSFGLLILTLSPRNISPLPKPRNEIVPTVSIGGKVHGNLGEMGLFIVELQENP